MIPHIWERLPEYDMITMGCSVNNQRPIQRAYTCLRCKVRSLEKMSRIKGTINLGFESLSENCDEEIIRQIHES